MRMKEEYYQFTEDLKMKAWDILAPIIFLIQFASPETSSLSVTVLWLHMKCAFRPRILWGAAKCPSAATYVGKEAGVWCAASAETDLLRGLVSQISEPTWLRPTPDPAGRSEASGSLSWDF